MAIPRHRQRSICLLLAGPAALAGLAALASLGSPDARAAEMPPAAIRSAVETWVGQMTPDARPGAKVEMLEPYEADGASVAYVAHLDKGGFCLCGAGDLLAPVYFYDPRGRFQHANPEHRFLLRQIAIRSERATRYARGEETPPAGTFGELQQQRAALWRELIAGRAPVSGPAVQKERTLPDVLLIEFTNFWHQDSPFNDQCPIPALGHDEPCAVGCVATASSQLMHYWAWPPSGAGFDTTSYRYRWREGWDGEPCPYDPVIPFGWGGGSRLQWTEANGGTLWMRGHWDWSVLQTAQNDPTIQNRTPEYLAALDALYDRLLRFTMPLEVDFSSATYDWSIIGPLHEDPPDPGDVEVAKLCFHTGVAVHMDYGVWGSSSSIDIAREGLVGHFRYHADAFASPINPYIIVGEIAMLRPAGMRGTEEGAPAGHMWIAHGYDLTAVPGPALYMNLGWGETMGWYVWDEWFPAEMFQLRNLAPAQGVQFVDTSGSGNGSPALPYGSIEEAVAEAPDNTTLILQAGGTYPFFAYELVIDRPLTLKGMQVTIGE